MAQNWLPKGANEIVERRWSVPLAPDDAIASVTATGTDVTVDAADYDGSEAVVVLSGGTSATTGSVLVTVETSDGNTHIATLLIGILATGAALGYTARDIVSFALRKVTGNGNDPDASELEDGLERLNDMLATWGGQGADLGTPLPLAAGDVLNVSDAFASAIKHNLILEVADLYNYEPSPRVVENARRGLQQIKAALLSSARAGAEYF